MHKITTIFLLAGTALSAAFGVQAQSAPGSDMSRYESIHEGSKPVRGQAAAHAVPKSIASGKGVETIGPSIGYSPSRSLGMSESLQPIVRPSIAMKAGGAVAVEKAPAPVAASPSTVGAATESTADDGKGGVINGVMRTR